MQTYDVWKWVDESPDILSVYHQEMVEFGPKLLAVSRALYPQCPDSCLSSNPTFSDYSPSNVVANASNEWGKKRTESSHVVCTSLLITTAGGMALTLVDCNTNATRFFVCRNTTKMTKSINSVKLTNSACSSGQFVCMDGGCVLDIYRCDNVSDCFDGSDEDRCHKYWSMKIIIYHLYYTCSNGLQRIPLSFLCDAVYQCIDFSDEHDCPQRILVKSANPIRVEINCTGSKVNVRADLLNDIVSDCPDHDDENELMETFSLATETWTEFKLWCKDHEKLPCLYGHSKCYHLSEKCQYDLNQKGHMKTCRNGGHLTDCYAFKCKNSFKCPKSYCIPWRRICDGNIDCPNRVDETNCKNYTCPGMFKCKGVDYCVHKVELCNNIANCPEGDDEANCNLPDCRNGCKCLGNAYFCENASLSRLPFLSQYFAIGHLMLPKNKLKAMPGLLFLLDLLTLDLSHNEVQLINSMFRAQRLLIKLDLSFNKISSMARGSLIGLESLKHLVLKGNKISTISAQSFMGLSSLQSLHLQNLSITFIGGMAFKGMISLKNVYLSNNSITILQKTFIGILRYNEIDIIGNPLEIIYKDTFAGITNINKIQSDYAAICCLLYKIADSCKMIKSNDLCFGILYSAPQKVLVWLLGILSLILNCISYVIIIQKIKATKRSPIDSVLLLNLLISNGLFSVYLLGLVVSDSWYLDDFMFYYVSWVRSTPCTLLRLLSTLSFTMSHLNLAFLVGMRYITIQQAMSHYSSKFIVSLCCIGWLFGSLYSAAMSFLHTSSIPTSRIHYFAQYSCNGILLLHTNVTTVSTIMCLITIAISMILINAFYIGIVARVRNSSNEINKFHNSKTQQNKTLHRVMKKVFMTDLYCSLPLLAMLILGAVVVGNSIEESGVLTAIIFIFSTCTITNPIMLLFYPTFATPCMGKIKQGFPCLKS